MSSIVVKYYLYHESLLSASSMTIMDKRVQKDSETFVQPSEERIKLVYASSSFGYLELE